MRCTGLAVDSSRTRRVTLNIKTGYEAIDFQEVARAEQLKPLELELRKAESMVDAVVTELEYMVSRETALRNTNGRDVWVPGRPAGLIGGAARAHGAATSSSA